MHPASAAPRDAASAAAAATAQSAVSSLPAPSSPLAPQSRFHSHIMPALAVDVDAEESARALAHMHVITMRRQQDEAADDPRALARRAANAEDSGGESTDPDEAGEDDADATTGYEYFPSDSDPAAVLAALDQLPASWRLQPSPPVAAASRGHARQASKSSQLQQQRSANLMALLHPPPPADDHSQEQSDEEDDEFAGFNEEQRRVSQQRHRRMTGRGRSQTQQRGIVAAEEKQQLGALGATAAQYLLSTPSSSRSSRSMHSTEHLSPRAAAQARSASAAAMAAAAASIPARPSTARRSATDVMRASTVFAQSRAAATAAVARPSSATTGYAPDGTKILIKPVLTPEEAVAQYALQQHEARLAGIAEAEARLDATMASQPREMIAANQSAQVQLLQRLAHEMSSTATEIEDEFGSGSGQLSAHAAKKAAAHHRARARGLSLVGVRAPQEEGTLSVLRNVSGWIESRSMDGLMSDSSLLTRAEQQSAETELVRLDAERALRGVIDRITLSPPLRIELLSKLQSTTAQALVDHTELIETLKRNLWKARYYLRDAVHTFEAEIASLKSQLQSKSEEVSALQQHEIENHELRLERAEQNEAAKQSAKDLQCLRSELAALTHSTLHSREEMSRLIHNDTVLRAQRDKAVEAERKASTQLTLALDRANLASDMHRALALKVSKDARSLKLKESQLDAVNEMFRSRRELIAKLREQKKREEEEAAAAAKRKEEEEAAAAAASAAEGASSTFLTEPKPDASSASAGAAAAPLPDASTLLLHHVRVNKKLYRLLQLHPDNASRRPDLMLELKGWILAAERQLRISMSRSLESVERGGRMSLSEIALLKLEQIRLLEEQRSKFRFLHQTELHASETAEQRAEREAQEAQENEALLAIIAQDRGASSEEEEEEERLRLREEYLTSSQTEGGEPIDEEQLAALIAAQDALDATEVQRMTDEERAARLRRAIERTSMTPADAKLDRRLERAEIREAKRRRRAEQRAAASRASMRQIDAAAREEATAGTTPGGAGEIDQAEGELQRLMHEAALKSPATISRLPSYMSPTGRRRSRRSLSPTAAAGSGSKSKASSLLSPSRRSTAKHEAAKARRKTQEDALALQRLLAQMDAAAASSKHSKLKSAQDKDKDKGQGGSPLKSPRASMLSAGRRRAKGKAPVANFVFADDEEPEEEELRKAEISSGSSSSEEEQQGEEGQPAAATKAGGEASESEAQFDAAPGAASASVSKPKNSRSGKGGKQKRSATDAATVPQSQSSPFLAAAYRTAPTAAPTKVAEAFWPGSGFFVAPQDPAEAAKQKADFEALVARTAQAQLDVWLAERRARESAARRTASTQCPANLVSLEEMHVLENFCEMPAIEAPEANKAPETGTHAKVDTGLKSNAIVPASPTHASSPSSAAAASTHLGSHRTVGVQVGVPPAFAQVDFFRWYLDVLLASLKQPVRGGVEVDPSCSLYANLGADKFDSLETATAQALNLIVPFDLTAGLRAMDNAAMLEAPKGKTKEESTAAAGSAGSKSKSKKQQQQQQQTEPPPFHPLGMDGSERVLDGHVIPDEVSVSPDPATKDGQPQPPHRRLRSDGVTELQSDAELHSFIDALSTLPEVDPRAGALFDPPAELTATEMEAKRQREMAAIVAMVAQIDRQRRVKTATLSHRKQTLRFLEGSAAEPPQPLDQALAAIERDRDRPQYHMDRGATQWDAALTALDATHGFSADRSNRPPPSSIDGSRLTPELQGTRWHRSIVMPTPGSAYDVSAIPMVALHQESQASQTDAATVDPAAYTGPVAPRKRHPILTHHFAPVPFHMRSYPLRAPVVSPGSDEAGMPNVLQELAERNAREGRVERAGSMVVTADRRPASAHAASSRTASLAASGAAPSSSVWMESVRDRLWAAQESLVRRRRQLLRAMVAPEGATASALDPQPSPRPRSSKPHGRSPSLSVDPLHSAASAYRPTPAQQSHVDAATRAFQKLEMFAQLRGEPEKTAAGAGEEKSAERLPAVSSASSSSTATGAAAPMPPRSSRLARRSSLLDRLVAQEAALRAAEATAERLAEASRERVQAIARRGSGHLAPTAGVNAVNAATVALVPQPPAAAAPSQPQSARARVPSATVGGHLRRHKQPAAAPAGPV